MAKSIDKSILDIKDVASHMQDEYNMISETSAATLEGLFIYMKLPKDMI